MRSVLLASTLFLSGCFLWKSPKPEAEVTTKGGKVVDAYADKNDLVMSRAAASIEVARDANAKGLPAVVEAELSVASTYLPKPALADLTFAKDRATKADPKAYAKAQQVADAHQRQLDSLWGNVEAEKEKARLALEAKEIELAAARKEKQTTMLSLVGAGLMTLGTLGMLFGLNRMNALVVIGLGACVASLPWFLDSSLFLPVAAAGSALVLLEICWLVWKKLKTPKCSLDSMLKKPTDEKTKEA